MDMRTVSGGFMVNISSLNIYTVCERRTECTVRVFPNQIIRDSKYHVEFACSMYKEDCEYNNGLSSSLMVELLNKYLDNCFTAQRERNVDEGSVFFYSNKIPRVGFIYDVCVIAEYDDDNPSDCTAWFIPKPLVSKLYKTIEHGEGACGRLLDAYKQTVNYGRYGVKWVHDEHRDNI